jgi:hypothetical protein
LDVYGNSTKASYIALHQRIQEEVVSGTSIAKVDTARRALAEVRSGLAKATSVEQTSRVRVQAEFILAIAKAARDRTLEIDAAEIHIRAGRLLGQIIASQRDNVGMARGSAGKGRPKKGGSRNNSRKEIPTLADMGIDKHLAQEARVLAAPTDDVFESQIAKWRTQMERGNKRVTINLMQSIRKVARGEQLFLPDLSQHSSFPSGRHLERILQEESYAPDWLTLSETDHRIVETIAKAMKRLTKLAARIGDPGAVAQFQSEFGRMEGEVTLLVTRYREIRSFIAKLEATAKSEALGGDARSGADPEEDHNADLEDQGSWQTEEQADFADVPF